jgi:hypothetical protein
MKLLASVICTAALIAVIHPARAQQSQQGMSDAEARMRIMLLQRSMQFGGIFRPAMDDWMRSPPADRCSGYSDSAAKQACKSGNGWAADRLQNKQSNPAERDWYNR